MTDVLARAEQVLADWRMPLAMSVEDAAMVRRLVESLDELTHECCRLETQLHDRTLEWSAAVDDLVLARAECRRLQAIVGDESIHCACLCDEDGDIVEECNHHKAIQAECRRLQEMLDSEKSHGAHWRTGYLTEEAKANQLKEENALLRRSLEILARSKDEPLPRECPQCHGSGWDIVDWCNKCQATGAVPK